MFCLSPWNGSQVTTQNCLLISTCTLGTTGLSQLSGSGFISSVTSMSADCTAAGVTAVLQNTSLYFHRWLLMHTSSEMGLPPVGCITGDESMQIICRHDKRFDKWFIWYSSQWLDWNNNQYNTIKSIQYYTRPRLIVAHCDFWSGTDWSHNITTHLAVVVIKYTNTFLITIWYQEMC